MKFLVVQGALLANPVFTATDKLLISFIYNLGLQNKRYFGTNDWLASELGIPEDVITKRLAKLIDFDVLAKYNDGIGLARSPEMTFQFSIDNRSRELLEDLVSNISNNYSKKV